MLHTLFKKNVPVLSFGLDEPPQASNLRHTCPIHFVYLEAIKINLHRIKILHLECFTGIHNSIQSAAALPQMRQQHALECKCKTKSLQKSLPSKS